MNVEQSVEWELVGETEVLGENVPQCHFAHDKSHKIWARTRAAAVGSQPELWHGLVRINWGRVVGRDGAKAKNAVWAWQILAVRYETLRR
jgi:hypothetical protein